MLNVEGVQTHPQRGAVAPRDDDRLNTGTLQQLQAMTVQGVETLAGFTGFSEIQTAIGEDAIDIQQQGANVFGLGQQCRREDVHQITLARIKSLLLTKPQSWFCAFTTNTLVMRWSSMSSAASAANALSLMVLGFGCITSPAAS